MCDAGAAAPDEGAPVGSGYMGKTHVLSLINAKKYLPPNSILFYDLTIGYEDLITSETRGLLVAAAWRWGKTSPFV